MTAISTQEVLGDESVLHIKAKLTLTLQSHLPLTVYGNRTETDPEQIPNGLRTTRPQIEMYYNGNLLRIRIAIGIFLMFSFRTTVGFWAAAVRRSKTVRKRSETV